MAHADAAPKVTVVPGPPDGGVVRETWVRVQLPFKFAFWRVRDRWLLRRGVIHSTRWWNPPLTTLLISLAWLMTLVLAAWGTRSLLQVLFFRGEDTLNWLGFDPDDACSDVGTSCGAITGLLMPLFLIASSTVIFLAWRLWRVRRFYARKAKKSANTLVQTAGSLMDEVVGRDQLCDALMNNLRDRESRRPHVIVGGVGVGKTAVLVRLTERLAARGAIPVPVRLRDVRKEEDLDFGELARKRFFEEVAPIVRSGAEQDRIWRWLRQRAGRIVVLADGLEDALTDDSLAGQRDNLIRHAIREAAEENLPLVIASRPHDPLRAMQATITQLEPLSEEAAVNYIEHNASWRSDPILLDRIVESARMTDSPLYLQIAKDLHRRDLLEPLWKAVGAGELPIEDRWVFRAELLHTWFDALVDGQVHPEIPIDPDTRQAVMEYISALACIGLAADSAVVPLRHLDPSHGGGGNGAPGHTDTDIDRSTQAWNRRVADHLHRKMQLLRHDRSGQVQPTSLVGAHCTVEIDDTTLLVTVDSPEGERNSIASATQSGPWMDVRLAATWATRMGVVRERGILAGSGDGRTSDTAVFFQHSIIQAYLGSRFLCAILPDGLDVRRETAPKGDQALIGSALRRGGRELHIALTLNSRSLHGRCRCKSGSTSPSSPCPVTVVRELLCHEVARQLHLAATEQHVDTEDGSPAPKPVHERREVRQTGDNRGGARQRALEAFGVAAEISSVNDPPHLEELLREAYTNNWWLGFGLGEDRARLREPKMTVAEQCGTAVRRAVFSGHHAESAAFEWLYKIGCVEPDYRVRTAIAQQIGMGGEHAYLDLYKILSQHEKNIVIDDPPSNMNHDSNGAGQDEDEGRRWRERWEDREFRAWQGRQHREKARAERQLADTESIAESELWYAETMRAWVLPLLVDSTPMTRHGGSPRNVLEDLVTRVTSDPATRPRNEAAREGAATSGNKIGLSWALAQGFKYAANRRPGLGTNQEGREFLIKQAEQLLQGSTFWYTRLTLLQALTLWALPDDTAEPHPIRGHGSDPKGQVEKWLKRNKGHETEHPLVEEAGRLAVRALQTRRPERFLWIDDALVASRLGTDTGPRRQPRFHNLWIPSSAGWTSLDTRARQLLADVLLLVVLGERGYRPKDLFRVLERATALPDGLPSCLSRDRTRLQPVRAVEGGMQPGDNCKDDCRRGMCPYPAKAEKNLRLEFDEIFCLHQRELLRAWQPRSWLYLRFRRETRWQRKVHIAGMRRFWDEMGKRARDADPDEVKTDR